MAKQDQNQKLLNTLVTALKGMGARDIQNPQVELAIAEITQKLDLANPQMVRGSLKMAIAQQMRADQQRQQIVRSASASEDVAVEELLNDQQVFAGLPANTCRQLLDKMYFHYDNAVDTMLCGVVHGLPEQPDMDENTAVKAAEYWGSVMAVGYEDFLQQNQSNGITAENCPVSVYKEMQTRLHIAEDLTKILGGDNKRALQILHQPINRDHPLLKNDPELLAAFERASATRQNTPNKAKGGNDLCVLDLLTAMAKSVTRAQILAFTDCRTAEQNQVAQDGSTIKENDPTRLANVVGKNGRAVIEQGIDANLGPKMVAGGKNAPVKPVFPRQWRGLNKLAAQMQQIVQKLYGPVQVGGFVARITGKNKKLQTYDNPAKPLWQTPEYQEMPEAYRDEQGKLNQAGEFFTKVQARLAQDRVQLLNCQNRMEQAQQPDPYLTEFYQYYQARIVADQNALDKAARAVQNDPALLTDANFFATLEQNTIELNNLPDPAINDLKQVPHIAQQIAYDQTQTAEGFYVDALHLYENCRTDPNPQTQAVGTQMLANLMEVQDRKDMTAENWQNLSQKMDQATIDKCVASLTKQKGAKPLSAADFREMLHNTVSNYLENEKYAAAKTNYDHMAKVVDRIQGN